MKIVLDATVLIRAHDLSRALARKLLHEILERGHRLVLSNEMINEAVKVLRYPEIRRLYALDETDLMRYAQFLHSVSDNVVLDPLYRAPFLRDANDLHVLQTAERGEADILCTNDRDFYDDAVLSFCATRGIYVCTEKTLISKLGSF